MALAIRLVAMAAESSTAPGFGDAEPYLFTADEIAQHGRFPDRSEPYFFRPPAYPLFLVAATFGHSDRIAAAKVANALLGSLAAVLLALLSARLFGRRALAIGTGLSAALWPSFVNLARGVQSEPLFLVFLLAAGLAHLVASDRESSGAAWAAGSALALAALTRPSALALAPLLAAPLFARTRASKDRTRLAAAGLFAFFLVLAPWTLRNALRFHEFIPVSDAGGVSLYAGNSRWTQSFYRLRSRDEYARWVEDFDGDLLARLSLIEARGAVLPGQRSAAFARMAIDESLADPAGSLRLLALKAWHWVRPYPTTWFWPPAVVAGVGVLYVALYGLAARGLLRSPRPGATVYCLAILGISMAAHVVLQVVWRYRVPYWDPILLLYGAFGATRR